MRSLHGRHPGVRDWVSGAVPDWLAEAARPKQVAVPWGTMARSVLAVWAPLAVGFITGRRDVGLLPAMGGLMSIMIDNGGPYLARLTRVSTAAVFGGAVGLTIGSVIHGRGWVAVVAVVAVAGVSAIAARLGATGSATGLQLMVYTSLGLGPLGALRPAWQTALEFVAGVAWALLLIVPGWVLSPRSTERRLVADVYHAIAAGLRAIGTPGMVPARHAVTAALNAAYDALLSGREAAGGRSRPAMHLIAILNASHPMTEAAMALRTVGERPPPWVIDTVDRLADVIGALPTSAWRTAAMRTAPAAALPLIPPQWSDSPGALALRESMVALTRVISGKWTPGPGAPTSGQGPLERLRAAAGYALDQLIGGWVAWSFTIRLMACTGVAAVMSEVLPLQRSYWVVLTVAIILKPDYGSVFARALQRGLGTVIGAAGGAVILAVVPYGPWLLLPFGVLAALLPYGKVKNFGLSATFLTPFVVLLIDLLEPSGWHLAGDRAVDTVLASAVVLVIGYAPWPGSWHAHLPVQFAGTLRVICAYMDESLVMARPGQPSPPGPARREGESAVQARAGQPAGSPARRSRLRRQASRSLSDLRAEYQRAMSEPEAASRRASALWPAIVGLEELLDAVTTTVVAIGRGAPAPAPEAVHQLTAELRAVAEAMQAGLELPPTSRALPRDDALEPVTAAVRSALSVLTPGERYPEPA